MDGSDRRRGFVRNGVSLFFAAPCDLQITVGGIPVAGEALKTLVDQRAKLVHDARAILDRAQSEGRDMLAEEIEQYEALDAQIEKLCDQIDAKRTGEQRQDRLRQYEDMLSEPLPRQVPPSRPELPRGATEAAQQTFGFGRAGELSLGDISETDPRLAETLRHRCGEKYRKAFLSYLRGEPRDYEQLGLVTGNDPQGGYLAPMAFVSTLIKFVDDMVKMRSLATVLPPTTAKSVGAVSFDTDYADADWTAEVPASDLSEDNAARFGSREMTPHLLTKLVKTSRKMLRSATLNLETFLAQRFAYRFALSENSAYMTGSGSQRPLGVFTASSSGIPTSRDTTCASTTTFTFDEVIDLKESVKDQYQARGTFFASRTFRKMCRKLKDGMGQYLLVENNAGTGVTMLLDRPLVVDENAPSTFTTGQYIAVFGDFSFYWIQDGINLEIQRLDELFSLRNQVGWIGRKETDGMPVLAEAFGRLILG